MEDVLAVYEKPYNPAQPVVCLDEKPVSLHADVRPPIAAKPGKPAKQDNEYERRAWRTYSALRSRSPGGTSPQRHPTVAPLSSPAWSGTSSSSIPSPRRFTSSWITRRIPDLAKLTQETKTWNGIANHKGTKIN